MPSPWVTDSFTDTAGTHLESHTGEVGATWTKHPNESFDCVITNANRLRNNSSGNASAYYASGTPQSANHDITADLYCASNPTGTNFNSASLLGRLSTGAQTYYMARYEADNAPTAAWQL